MTDRKKYNSSDVLLDAYVHPVGSRLILKDDGGLSNDDLYEVVIKEWSPSLQRVLLEYMSNFCKWKEIVHYTPIVIEVLPPVRFVIEHAYLDPVGGPTISRLGQGCWPEWLKPLIGVAVPDERL